MSDTEELRIAERDRSGVRKWVTDLRMCWAIMRTGLRLVLRRRLLWIILALAGLNFLLMYALIYFRGTFAGQPQVIRRIAEQALEKASGSGESYREFIFGQGVICIVLLAFAGATMIGSDFRQGGATFYLSRRVNRYHYFLGKLLAVATLVSSITTLPAMILFFEFAGMVAESSFEYISENWQALFGIVCYGSLIALVLSLLLFATAAWMQKTLPLVMLWAVIFVLVPAVAHALRELFQDRSWLTLNLWWDIRLVGKRCFGTLSNRDAELFFPALAILCVVCTVAILATLPRIRAVRVVE